MAPMPPVLPIKREWRQAVLEGSPLADPHWAKTRGIWYLQLQVKRSGTWPPAMERSKLPALGQSGLRRSL